MNVRRGDIVVVEFPFASGMESKRRPCVVVQCDRNNVRLDNVIVAQITTRLHPPNEPTRFVIDPQTPDGQQSGLPRLSVAACENLVTVEKRMIQRQIGELSPTLLSKLNDALKASLGLT